TIRFDAPVTSAQFHPINRKLIVVTLQSQEEAIFVDLRSQGGRWELDARQSHQSTNPEEDTSTLESPEKKQGFLWQTWIAPKEVLLTSDSLSLPSLLKDI
ncbi:chromatin binding protein, partial [Puccinia graminis f. sp. tritici]